MTNGPKNLRVGFLFDDTLDGSDGVAQYVKTLGAWLSGQGHQVSYLVGETKLKQWAGGQVFSLARNQRVIFNGNRLSVPLPAARQKIRQVLAAGQFDVLHVQVPYSPFMSQRAIGLAPPRTAIIGTFHVFPAGLMTKIGSRILKIAYLGSLRRFDRMLAVSPAAAGFAANSFGLKCQVLPNVVEVKRYARVSPPFAGGQKIVFLGRLVERKGCLQLLRAFRLLRARLPDAVLEIAGDGPQRTRLESFARKAGLADRVKFLGRVAEAQKPRILAGADIACFPSLYGESFGIVLIEAMAAGAGVVLGGDNPGYRSVFGSRADMLVEPRDTPAFARRLELFLMDKNLAEEVHKWQQQRVKLYDVSYIGPKLLAIYREEIAKAASRRHN